MVGGGTSGVRQSGTALLFPLCRLPPTVYPPQDFLRRFQRRIAPRPEVSERQGNRLVRYHADALEPVPLGGGESDLADVQLAAALQFPLVKDPEDAAAGLAPDNGGAGVLLQGGGEQLGAAAGAFVHQHGHRTGIKRAARFTLWALRAGRELLGYVGKPHEKRRGLARPSDDPRDRSLAGEEVSGDTGGFGQIAAAVAAQVDDQARRVPEPFERLPDLTGGRRNEPIKSDVAQAGRQQARVEPWVRRRPGGGEGQPPSATRRSAPGPT